MSAVERALRSELERLQAEAEQHRARLSEIRTRLSQIEADMQEIERSLGGREADHEHVRESAVSETNIATATNSFHGLGQPGAVTLLLQMEGREMTAPEIMRELEHRGFTIVGRSVDWAVKRAAKLGHIKKVRRGVWAYNRSSPSPVDAAEGDHPMKTRAGLARAKERGVRLGPPPKITEEHRVLAASMFEESKTIAEIAKACGASAVYMGKRIREWREEGRFPQKRQPKGRKPKSEDRSRTLLH